MDTTTLPLIMSHPPLETSPMACAMSLEEEFNQYKADLMTLEERVQRTRHAAEIETHLALDEVRQTLIILDGFAVQTKSSRAILYMAERSASLIERISQHCDDLTAH